MEAKEKEIAGASYVLTFYRDVQELNNNYVQYCNLLIELEAKEHIKMGIEERQILIQAVQVLRENIQKSYIEYTALISNIDIEKNVEKDKELADIYKELTTKFIIQRDKVGEYVKHINNFLIRNVIRTLLQTSEDLITSMYGATQPLPPPKEDTKING